MNLNNLEIYIKFIKKEYLNNFINKGEFHFGSIRYYRQLGKNNSIIGDSEEGTKHHNYKYGDTITIQSHTSNKRFVHKLLPQESANFRINVNDNAHIYCMSRITSEDLYKISNGNYKIKQSVIKKLQENFPKDTYTPILMKNFNIIISKLFNHFHTSKFSESVEYYSKSNKDLALKKVADKFKDVMSTKEYNASKDIFNAFVKKDKYKDQKELRILITDGHDLDKHENISIGDISDYIYNIGNLNNSVISFTHKK